MFLAERCKHLSQVFTLELVWVENAKDIIQFYCSDDSILIRGDLSTHSEELGYLVICHEDGNQLYITYGLGGLFLIFFMDLPRIAMPIFYTIGYKLDLQVLIHVPVLNCHF